MWRLELFLFRWLQKRHAALERKWGVAKNNIFRAHEYKEACQREIDRGGDSYSVRKSMEACDDEIKRYSIRSHELAKRLV